MSHLSAIPTSRLFSDAGLRTAVGSANPAITFARDVPVVQISLLHHKYTRFQWFAGTTWPTFII
jgi:hypothetical protein